MVERSGRETTVTSVGSPTAGVDGSSEGCGCGFSLQRAVAWLAITVPLAVSSLTRAVKRTTAAAPGSTAATAQLTVLPESEPPSSGVT